MKTTKVGIHEKRVYTSYTVLKTEKLVTRSLEQAAFGDFNDITQEI